MVRSKSSSGARTLEASVNKRELRKLSCLLGPASMVASESMDTTSNDGLPSAIEPSVTIVLDTPHGRVVSLPLPHTDAMAVANSLESGLSRVQQFRVDTAEGRVLLSGDLLRQCLIRFNLSVCTRKARSSPRRPKPPVTEAPGVPDARSRKRRSK